MTRGTLAALSAIVLGTTACTIPFGDASAEDTRQPAYFVDEFDGPARPLRGAWIAETGGGGWGNNEAQVYSDSTDNVRIDGAGHLAITARRVGDTITSARLTTQGRFSMTYGRVEARISLPAGAGLHPAFWMLGDGIDRVGWPEAGEIDIIETINQATEYHTGIHAPQTSSRRGQTVSASGRPPSALPGTFHTYWMEKSPGRIETGIDDTTVFTATPADLAADSRWVFDSPFHLLFTLAVGGNWPGDPETAALPATMLVDSVRVSRS
ncbi:glycoside hydrolase family 16 protein [Gordonia insulae]|uniref:glycoside hydrolase family 16 protein n=1 Tax=Gordonia insulae TaxID=2420509 RepID=UPI0038CC11B2